MLDNMFKFWLLKQLLTLNVSIFKLKGHTGCGDKKASRLKDHYQFHGPGNIGSGWNHNNASLMLLCELLGDRAVVFWSDLGSKDDLMVNGLIACDRTLSAVDDHYACYNTNGTLLTATVGVMSST